MLHAVIHHKHQRLTGSGRGETSFCAAGHSCPSISAAYQFQSPFLPADHSRRGRILPRPRRASYSHSRAGLLPGRCDRRLVHTPLWAGRLPICRSVDVALRSLPHNTLCQDRYVLECHSLSSFHGVTFHSPEHDMEGVGSAQILVGENQHDRDC